VARRHVRVDLLDNFVGLWVTWGDDKHRKLICCFSCANNEKRTSDRSFGAAALSIGPAPKTAAIPPVLRSRRAGREIRLNGQCEALSTNLSRPSA
jgi:hypothetical protein